MFIEIIWDVVSDETTLTHYAPYQRRAAYTDELKGAIRSGFDGSHPLDWEETSDEEEEDEPTKDPKRKYENIFTKPRKQ